MSDRDDKIHELPEFKTLLKEMRKGNALTLEAMGESLGYSATYLSDLERGKRLPSVQFIDRVCEWSGRGPGGRKIWHIAGATAHGWEIDYDTCGGDGEPAEIDDEEVNNALRNLGLLQADIRIKQHTRNRINGLSDLITRLYHQTREDRDVALAIAETYNGELQDKLKLAERQRDEALESFLKTAAALREDGLADIDHFMTMLNKPKVSFREGEVVCIKERTGYFTHHSEPMYWRVPAEWASIPDSARALNHSELPSYVHDLVDAVLKAELMACSEGYSYGEIHKFIYEALVAYRKESGYE